MLLHWSLFPNELWIKRNVNLKLYSEEYGPLAGQFSLLKTKQTTLRYYIILNVGQNLAVEKQFFYLVIQFW